MTRRMLQGLSWNWRCCSVISDTVTVMKVEVGGKVTGELGEAVAAWRRLPLTEPYCM